MSQLDKSTDLAIAQRGKYDLTGIAQKKGPNAGQGLVNLTNLSIQYHV